MKQEYWRVHVSRLLVEICNNPQCSSLVTPLRILRNKLAEVAQRAAELNDDKLNGLMAELALYSVADPDDKDFDSQVKESVIKKGRAAQIKQQHDRNRLLSKPHPGPAGTSEEAVGAELPQQQPAP